MTTKVEARKWAETLMRVLDLGDCRIEVAQHEEYRLDPPSPLGWGVRSVAGNPYWCGPIYISLEKMPTPWAMVLLEPEDG